MHLHPNGTDAALPAAEKSSGDSSATVAESPEAAVESSTAAESEPVAEEKKPPLKRFTIDLTREEHRFLKGEAVKAGLSMRALALQILYRAGVLGPDLVPASTTEEAPPG